MLWNFLTCFPFKHLPQIGLLDLLCLGTPQTNLLLTTLIRSYAKCVPVLSLG